MPEAQPAPAGTAVKVYLDDGGDKRLVGRADVLDTHDPVFEVPLFGGASMIDEWFTLGTVTQSPRAADPCGEALCAAVRGHRPEVLPGWQPLSSQRAGRQLCTPSHWAARYAAIPTLLVHGRLTVSRPARMS